MITANIHNVKRMHTENLHKLKETNTYVRKIVAVTGDGSWVEFTFFSDDPESLAID